MRLTIKAFLATRVGGKLLLEPETDQQVRAQTHTLPADKHHQEVVAQYQQQHRTHKQVQIGEVALVTRILRHVADRVDMDPETNKGHHKQHHRRQRVEEEAELDIQIGPAAVGHLQLAGRYPEIEVLFERLVCRVLRAPHITRDDEKDTDKGRDTDRAAGDPRHRPLRDAISQEDAVEQHPDEGKHRYQPE
jgi:hypothetical protein